MGKVVKFVGKVVNAVATVASFIPGPHQPLAKAIAIGSGLLVGAVDAIDGSPKIPQSSVQLGRLQATLDTQAPRKIVLGPDMAFPADIRYYEGSGEDEEYVDYVIALAAHRIGTVKQIWFEDELAWSSAAGVHGDYVGYLSNVTVRTEGNAANTIAINGGARWGSDDRLTGCAYLRLRVKRTGNSDSEQSPLASGLPGRVTIIGDGMPMYDPRYDSTVGGSGSQRIDDQATWGPSSGNLVIQALNVLIGWRINGRLSVGAGLPAKYLDLDSAITAANICDEPINLSTGGTQPRYRGAGAFSTDDSPMNIVTALLAGCAGDLLDSEGRLSFLIKANTLAMPAVTFDDHDVVSGAQWDPMGGKTNVPNIISGSYVDPGALYQLAPYPSVEIASEDGIDRTAPVDFGVVENAPQAERLGKQTLQRMQYPGTFTAEYNMKGMAAKVGRIVWQTYSPRGWVDKPFRVVSQRPSRSGRIALVLREEHASIYAWEAEDSAAVQPAEPVRFDPRNAGPVLLARKAAQTADWPKVTDSENTKPEDNATEGANVPDADGSGGNIKDANGDPLPPGYIRNDLISLTPDGILGFYPLAGSAMEEIGRLSIVDLGGAEASATAKANAAADRLAEATIRLASAHSTTRADMRDAGIHVDPETGQVRIWTVEQTQERLSEAEVRVHAAEAAITLRATTNYVDEKIAQAVLDPTQIADLEDLQIRIGEAEVAIDANAASITSKADLLELNAVQGRVTSAEENISALVGVVSTKVDTVTFTSLESRVSSAEQTITALGDVAGITQVFRAARVLERESDANAQSALQALLEADRERRTRVVAVAEARQELSARIQSEVGAEAAARQALAVRVGAAEAGVLNESTARVAGDNALSQQISALSAEIDDNAAAITAEETARASGDSSLAQSIQTVSSGLSGLNASVTTIAEAVDGIEAKAGVRLDVNGRITGFVQNNDGVEGDFVIIADRFAIVDPDGGDRTEYADGVWRIYAGAYMKVTGSGFGTNGQFIEWYGPIRPIAQCNEADAISYQRRDGSAYFGGTLSAGITKNAVKTTSLAANASISTGPVGSNGGSRVVVLSYNWSSRAAIFGACPAPATPSATIKLYREGTEIGTLALTGTVSCLPALAPGEPGLWQEDISGSITVTDNTGGADVEYSATIVARALTSPGPDVDPDQPAEQSQTLSITQTEE